MGEAQSARLTAIRRMGVSVPMQYLRDQGLLAGPVLDFGCGRGEDASALKLDSYDPYFQPKLPPGKYQTITCIYVLNTLLEDQASKVIEQVKEKLQPGGVAYFAVRRDLRKEGYTSRGTFQRNVKLDMFRQAEIKGKFAIYKFKKEEH